MEKSDKPPSANQITAELLLRVQQEIPSVWIWRNNRIDAKVPMGNGRKRHVSAGINGQGDLSGIIGPIGRRLEIEVKADYQSGGSDRQSPVQEAFQRAIESRGGVYLLAEHIGWNAGKPDVSLVLEKLKALL